MSFPEPYTDLKPVHYDILLDVDLTTLQYVCDETITVDVLKPASTVKLNSYNISVPKEDITAILSNGSRVSPVSSIFDKDAQLLTFSFAEQFVSGQQIKLVLHFSKEVSSTLMGFYRSKYTTQVDGKEETRYMGVTQFESTWARAAFPCWDHPAAKATFSLSIVTKKELDVLSNMPVKEELVVEGRPDWKKTVFEETPKMSTYLLAFVIGEFDHISAKTKNNVTVSVYTMKGKTHLGKLALETGVYTLDFYTDFFGIGYPLPKCDMIAIPDFDAGAMENWGLVTYRDSALLFDEEHGSLKSRKRVATVVAHELAHQWFGNLCTMRWWNDLWLNEGFATYMQYFSIDEKTPEFNLWDDFVALYCNSAFALDSKESSHPINVHVVTPDEITSIFDSISYEKGSSVIRMIASFLGKEKFRNALQKYLSAHLYGNTVTQDLWDAFSQETGQDIGKLMRTWTENAGYPLVVVSRDEKTGHLKLTQSRFFDNGKQDTEVDRVWWIPLTFISNDEGFNASPVQFQTKEIILDDKTLAPGHWVKLNVNTTSFCRILYSGDLLKELTVAIKEKKLSPIDRLCVLGDARALARAGIMDNKDFLQLILAYDNEDNGSVISVLSGCMSIIQGLFDEEEYSEQIKKFVIKVFKPMIDKLGWDTRKDDTPTQIESRRVILKSLVLAGEKETVAEALRRFDQSKDGKRTFAVEYSIAVYTAVAMFGDRKTQYPRLFTDYAKLELKEEQTSLLYSLGHCKTDEEVEYILKWAMDGKNVRSQDLYFITGGVTDAHAYSVWNWLTKNWEWYCDTLVPGSLCFAYCVGDAVLSLRTEEDLIKMDEFFKEHDPYNSKPKIISSRAVVLQDIKWKQKCVNDGILEWMKKNI